MTSTLLKNGCELLSLKSNFQDGESVTQLKRYSKAFVLGGSDASQECSGCVQTLRRTDGWVWMGFTYFSKSWPMSAKAVNSRALPAGSRKNMVACSPTSPLKRTQGSMTKVTPALRRRSASLFQLSVESTTP